MSGAPEYSQVWLIECKNYSGSVPVSDVEEFFTKVQQVAAANSKAIMASGSAFESGGVNFARSKQMSILRYFSAANAKWELYRSPSASFAGAKADSTNDSVLRGITLQDFESSVFDFYIECPGGPTNSLWDFMTSLLSTEPLTEAQLKAMSNSANRPSRLVPFLELGVLETEALRSFMISDIEVEQYRLTTSVPARRDLAA